MQDDVDAAQLRVGPLPEELMMSCHQPKTNNSARDNLLAELMTQCRWLRVAPPPPRKKSETLDSTNTLHKLDSFIAIPEWFCTILSQGWNSKTFPQCLVRVDHYLSAAVAS